MFLVSSQGTWFTNLSWRYIHFLPSFSSSKCAEKFSTTGSSGRERGTRTIFLVFISAMTQLCFTPIWTLCFIGARPFWSDTTGAACMSVTRVKDSLSIHHGFLPVLHCLPSRIPLHALFLLPLSIPLPPLLLPWGSLKSRCQINRKFLTIPESWTRKLPWDRRWTCSTAVAGQNIRAH